jgi:glutathione synthase/RimK-type ligase-like ATP-grasp enzyme
MSVDVVVIHEHPEWQKPLFAALERRGVSFAAFNVTEAAFSDTDVPDAVVYFNQASPSAYLRGNTRAVPLALSFMRQLQWRGAKVLNGADVFAFELSKTAQSALLQTMGIDHPRGISFNSLAALRRRLSKGDVPGLVFPALLKPEQGGSGARITVVDSFDDVEGALKDDAVWTPDHLFVLQEYLPHDPAVGIVRLEFVGGELLYAMRVVSHGRFNLCPAPVCNPDDGGASACAIPTPAERAAAEAAQKPVEFYPFPEVPDEAVATAKRIVKAAGIDVGGIEYLETNDGRRCFYDINANSNLRPSVAQAFGFDPFDRVVDFLVSEVTQQKSRTS